MKKYILRIVVIIAVLYLGLVLVRMVHFYNQKNTDMEVAKIHATRLTLDDVMGKSLPPDPGREADKTVTGVDANKNGIRDDVELAIFKAYPDSARTRAVLLQYALALQMEVTQAVVNTETVTAVAEVGDRAYLCVGKIVSRVDMKKYSEDVDRLRGFVENIQLNTQSRKNTQNDFYDGNLGSYTSPQEKCDLDVLVLSN